MRVQSWRADGMTALSPDQPICAWALCDSDATDDHTIEHLSGRLRIVIRLCAAHIEQAQNEPFIVTVQIGGDEPFIAVSSMEPTVGSPTIEESNHG